MKITLIILSISLVMGCSKQGIYTPSAPFNSTNTQEINDEDIKKAYMAKPQIVPPSALAFYNLTQGEKEFEKGLSTLKKIKSIYKIPSILVEGLGNQESSHYRQRSETPPVSIKKLRLLGARSHSDLLLVYANRAETEVTVNPWIVSSVLLITPLFMPMYDVKVTMKINVWLMDIRNGYLYKEISLSASKNEKYLNLFNMDKASDTLLAKLKTELFPTVMKEIKKTLSKGKTNIVPPPHCAPCPECNSPASPSTKLKPSDSN
jgi:hypothetical protein